MNQETRKPGKVKRLLPIGWTCSDYVKHYHRWKWSAWICGRLQRSFTPRFLVDTHRRYYELIYAVETKYPMENRHETALRYIKERETGAQNCIGKTNQQEAEQHAIPTR